MLWTKYLSTWNYHRWLFLWVCFVISVSPNKPKIPCRLTQDKLSLSVNECAIVCDDLTSNSESIPASRPGFPELSPDLLQHFLKLSEYLLYFYFFSPAGVHCTWQFSQHSPCAHWAPLVKLQVWALQHGLLHSCNRNKTLHKLIHCYVHTTRMHHIYTQRAQIFKRIKWVDQISWLWKEIKRGSSLLLSHSHTPRQGRAKHCRRRARHKSCLSWDGPAGSRGWHSPEMNPAHGDCNYWTDLGTLRQMGCDKPHKGILRFVWQNTRTSELISWYSLFIWMTWTKALT